MNKLCLVISFVCFLLAVLGFNPTHFNTIALGLMFGALAKLVN